LITRGVNVSRHAPSFSTRAATTHRCCSRTAGDPGNSDAVCPSDLRPSKQRSRQGSAPASTGHAWWRTSSYSRAAASASGSSPSNAVHVGCGNRHAPEQSLGGHAVIAVRMIRWHAAFVAPEDVDPAPLNGFAVRYIRQQPVQCLGRPATRQGHTRRPARGHGSRDRPRETRCRGLRDGLGRIEDGHRRCESSGHWISNAVIPTVEALARRSGSMGTQPSGTRTIEGANIPRLPDRPIAKLPLFTCRPASLPARPRSPA
jgi:hypothetical protein